MYKTEKEIFNQYISLNKSYEYLQSQVSKIKQFQKEHPIKSLTFIGCGSSYSLCKSGEITAKSIWGIQVHSFAAGDLMLNCNRFKKVLRNTILIVPSRSGATSEVVKSVKFLKELFNNPCISICMKENSELKQLSELTLELPWAFDESVCQTQTVTNLYMSILFLLGHFAEDKLLIEDIRTAIKNGPDYIKEYSKITENIAKNTEWEKVVVLADSELEGIALEGALAFNEIAQLPSNYYHVLDVRHGPMVLIDQKTLVIVVCSPNDENYQKDLITDLKKHNAKVISISMTSDYNWGSDFSISIPRYNRFCVVGIPFIFIPQSIALYKAIAKGINPDKPSDLQPWILLK
jgi:glucosamine--fructose-6-phosphate aminotransferase (isomerizing)